MYKIDEYAWMLSDRLRRDAFLGAMQKTITPESVVLDLGAGAGILSLVACKMGARKVYAIDPNPLIKLLPEAAAANGFGDRITWYCDDSRAVELPERVDLIIADIRGALPFVGGTLNIMQDACARFLKPGGTVMPNVDEIFLCPVSDDVYFENRKKWWTEHGLDVDLSHLAGFGTGLSQKSQASADGLLSNPAQWGRLELKKDPVFGIVDEIEFSVTQAGRFDGFIQWFDLGFSTGERLTNHIKSPPLVYGRGFFPIRKPVQVNSGDTIQVCMRVHHQRNREVWFWSGYVRGSDKVIIADFSESDLKLAKIYSQRSPISN